MRRYYHAYLNEYILILIFTHMEGPGDPIMFLVWVAIISASGVIAPGPLFAAAIAKGLDDPRAGVKLSIGHAIVEVPLILTIFFGLMVFLKDDNVLAVIGLVGGAFLLYMGVSLFKSQKEISNEDIRYTSIMSGIILTAVNPYFLLWWATVGAAMIGLASGFGWWMIPLFIVIHLSCDFAYMSIVSYSANIGKSILHSKWIHRLYTACGIFLILFALYFISSSFRILLLS